MKRIRWLVALFFVAVCLLPFRQQLNRPFISLIQKVKGSSSVAERLDEFGSVVRTRLKSTFDQVSADYPPKRMTLVGLKAERVLEVWVPDELGEMVLVRRYPILGASGTLGPKLEEGDLQVPEGLYRVESLNPNSMFHLSIKINYPNSFDREQAERDGRTNPGSNIFIHGYNASVGCLAMGNEVAEELFVLAALTGIENISVILSPVDFRERNLPKIEGSQPVWVDDLYRKIEGELTKLYRGGSESW